MTPRVVLVCGAGGVGKTTTAAALALGHALLGARVVVLTIDPARRLADALGLDVLGNTPTPVDLDGLDGTPGGALHALMLDRKATWDEVIRQHAPDAELAERLLANPYYDALSTRLTGGHEYMATEKLHQLTADPRWDLIVVDTPPAAHAIDFFQAPERIRRILDQRLLAALFQPGGGLLAGATRRVVDVVRRLAGDQVLDDLADFFGLVSGLAQGFRDRGASVRDLLRAPTTAALVVAAARDPRPAGLRAFRDQAAAEGVRVRAVLLNRSRDAASLPADADARLARLAATHPAADDAIPAFADLIARRRAHAEAHARHADAVARALGLPVRLVPDQPGNLDTLAGLATLARAADLAGL